MKKSIFFITGSMRKGGAERVISNIVNEIEEIDIYIITLLDSSVEYDLNENIKIIDLSRNGSYLKNVIYWIVNLRRSIKYYNPKTIVSFIGRVNIITIISCLFLKKKVIVSERNDPRRDGRSKFLIFITKLLYSKADLIIYQTKYAQNCLENIFTRKKSIVIPNPINTEALKYTNKLKKSFKFISVGRLEKQKNHELLINVFTKFHELHDEVILEIYGDGSLKNYLEELIGQNHATDFIFLMGRKNNIFKCICDAKYFVLPSLYEGFSNVLLEAMTLGLICISSNCAGSVELIKNGVNGYLFENNDAESLFSSLEKAYFSDEKYIKTNIHESVLNYDNDSVIAEWKNCIL